MADPKEQEQAAARSWMARYLELYGPVGQSAEEIDFEGFRPTAANSCACTRSRPPASTRCPTRSCTSSSARCVIALGYLPLDCENRDTAAWCVHLLEARRCLSDVQIGIEGKWGSPGLLEFQISETEPRSTASMTGRCIQQELAERARAIQP